jgi:hypothetical protein
MAAMSAPTGGVKKVRITSAVVFFCASNFGIFYMNEYGWASMDAIWLGNIPRMPGQSTKRSRPRDKPSK